MGRLDVGRNGVWAALKHTVGAGSRQGGLAVQAVGERAALEGGLHPGFRASWDVRSKGTMKMDGVSKNSMDLRICGLKDKIQHCVAYSRVDTTPYPHPNP
eukprot:1150284-Pelagomonas_calceolata.AAC.3